jgi:hypothetical protein
VFYRAGKHGKSPIFVKTCELCSIRTKSNFIKNLLARQDPTTNKIRHLVHLEDYRASAQEGIVHACRVIERINKWIDTQHPAQHPAQPFWDAGQSFQSRFSVIEEDLIFLRDQLIDISQELKELQQTLREHLELTHNRRNFILTIIAAVYLPLSFATSFFGMNINTTTPAGPQGFSNWTASWIANSPVDIQNSTKALASTIGSSGTETYPWKTFIITSVCLIITLPISLTFGTIFRVLYRNATYYATYWRALAVVPTFAIFFFSTFGKYLGLTDTLRWSILRGSLGAPSLYSFLHMCLKDGTRLGMRLFWVILFVVGVLCFGIDDKVPYFPLAIIPWGMALFFCVLPWWRGRSGQHNT